MVIKLTGNIDAIDAFGRKVKELGSAKARRAIMVNVGEELVDLVREGFAKESDPYGKRWSPLKRRKGRILQDTGRLRNSFRRQSASASRVVVSTRVFYATFHQSGTKGRGSSSSRAQQVTRAGRFTKMRSEKAFAKALAAGRVRLLEFSAGGGKIPARPMLPSKGLPRSWKNRVLKVAMRAWKSSVGFR